MAKPKYSTGVLPERHHEMLGSVEAHESLKQVIEERHKFHAFK
jgi:hypothetical protein